MTQFSDAHTHHQASICNLHCNHYSDVIMGAIESQVTNLTIVHSTVYSHADQKKHQSSAPLAFVRGTGEFPTQMASNAENVSISWRRHVWHSIQVIQSTSMPSPPRLDVSEPMSMSWPNISQQTAIPRSRGMPCHGHSIPKGLLDIRAIEVHLM